MGSPEAFTVHLAQQPLRLMPPWNYPQPSHSTDPTEPSELIVSELETEAFPSLLLGEQGAGSCSAWRAHTDYYPVGWL
jgi:hypothetical protein